MPTRVLIAIILDMQLIVCALICRSTRRSSVINLGNRRVQRTEFHPAEPTSDPPDDRRSTGRYSTPPLLCVRTCCGWSFSSRRTSSGILVLTVEAQIG
jgi:hypothetical protein